MNSYFAYTRVSTAKQGQFGVLLVEQHEAIARFAVVHDLPISQWFEETETAARTGRFVFKAMVARLSRGEAWYDWRNL